MSLVSLLRKISSTGVPQLPWVEQIKIDMNNHGIGETKKKNQVFNVNEDGMTISCCKDDSNVPTTHKTTCVLVKKSAFAPDAWKDFATCKYKLIVTFQFEPSTKLYIGNINCYYWFAIMHIGQNTTIYIFIVQYQIWEVHVVALNTGNMLTPDWAVSTRFLMSQ